MTLMKWFNFRSALCVMVILSGLRTAGSQPGNSAPAGRVHQLSQAAKIQAWMLLNDFVGQIKVGLISEHWTTGCILRLPDCRSSTRALHTHTANSTVTSRNASNGPGQRETTSITSDPDQAVWYNQIAGDYLSQVLQQNAHQRLSSGAIKPFPVRSMIVIPSWHILSAGSAQQVSISLYPGGQSPDMIDLGNRPCDSVPQIGAIPIKCFYSVTISEKNLPFFRLEFNSIGVGDILILVGLHIIEKQIITGTQGTQWRWSTFWWQRRTTNLRIGNYPCINSGAFLCQNITPPWNKYVMDTVEVPRDGEVIAPVFNPYLDSNFRNGPSTNCVVCHSFAASPMHCAANVSPLLGAHSNTTVQTIKGLRDSYLKGTLSTDMLWTLEGALDRGYNPTQTLPCPDSR